MALEVILTTDRYDRDVAGRELLDALQSSPMDFVLNGAVFYYDFPTYGDYEAQIHTPSALLLSPKHGVIAIRALSSIEITSGNQGALVDVEEEISQFCSILIGRLLKSRQLRRGVASLKFEVTPIIYAPGLSATIDLQEESGLPVITSMASLRSFFDEIGNPNLSPDDLAEARSVIEGAKALTRPVKRSVGDPASQKAAVALVQLESEIANFDEKQRRAALSTVAGPQRIRGLAGSGKTVILAMKAAHLHLTNPEAKILITFYTKSLNETIRSLITKFYRHYKDEDPDWTLVHIRHGWGGGRKPGVYHDACVRAGVESLSFPIAKQRAGVSDPFDFACATYLQQAAGDQAYYDYFLIDEGQDFPSSFYRLAYNVTKGGRDRKNIVWAYDELQNILDVKIRSPEELFGADAAGALISLDRSSANLPRGAENDIVLSKCYRNQREVLVVAHALGFGIYGQLVQMLESADHWGDVGYEVKRGDFNIPGSSVVIERPAKNSPLSIGSVDGYPIIDCFIAQNLGAECAWAVAQVRSFISGGLNPHDIVVVCLDDRNVRYYFKEISSLMAAANISSHNLSADSFSDLPFFAEGRVTLSTIYKAKGNEAPAVIVVGLDGAGRRTRAGRNKVFTALTRSKAWVRVSGMGEIASGLMQEISVAMQEFPNLKFAMPDLTKINFIQRDMGKKQAAIKKIRDQYLKQLQAEGFTEDEAMDLLEERNGATRGR
ncbi:ATP-binding domain-containing protein [Xanthomonas campestris pv. phormiicola]|nr:ATP-binding domain-containing protein [Xanthomonas campestris pv. phormiicola]UYC15979.1 ATP-binding domain-containing protein [Xanthomonas campestris pv. phormiicola]